MTRSLAGIYKITNQLTGKVYVGQSQNVYKRETEHFTALRYGKHPNKEMQKDGNHNNHGFRFDVIELIPLSKLNEREKYGIDKLHSMSPDGYNLEWVPYKRKAEKKPKVRKYHKTR